MYRGIYTANTYSNTNTNTNKNTNTNTYSNTYSLCIYLYIHTLPYIWKCACAQTYDSTLNVCRDVSHRSKNKWEISPFSGNVTSLLNYGSGDHHEISYYFTSHRNRKCSSMGKNGKGNCGKMLHFIEHLNVRGEMRCHREDPDALTLT